MTYDYADFLVEALAKLRALPSDGDVMGQVYRSPHLKRSGTWVEFGVSSGGTLTRMAEQKGEAKLWGFDSFDGLPEAWPPVCGPGAFAVEHIPKVHGAHIVSGLFQDTLQCWIPPHRITLAHIDCDIYSAAKCALQYLLAFLADGAIIVFDELWNYPTFADNEMKALYEAKEEGLKFDWLYANADGGPGGPAERAAILVRR